MVTSIFPPSVPNRAARKLRFVGLNVTPDVGCRYSSMQLSSSRAEICTAGCRAKKSLLHWVFFIVVKAEPTADVATSKTPVGSCVPFTSCVPLNGHVTVATPEPDGPSSSLNTGTSLMHVTGDISITTCEPSLHPMNVYPSLDSVGSVHATPGFTVIGCM